MIRQSKGKIFLADDRTVRQNENSRTYFHFNTHSENFGSLHSFNDETLAGGRSLRLTVTGDCRKIIIPVVGSVQYSDDSGNSRTVHPGEILLLNLVCGSMIEIECPYEKELINFLNIGMYPEYPIERSTVQVFRFNLNQQPGLIEHNGIAIGRFPGRYDTNYKMKDPLKGAFIFVIEGVFEVQGRLLHSRDGLSLWKVGSTIEMEALSNDAILLLLEIPA